MHERRADRGGRIEHAGRECLDRERWRLFCRDHTLGNEASETIDELIDR